MFYLIWGLMTVFQWLGWATTLMKPFENSEEPSVYANSEDLPLTIDVPWYTRPLFGLPPIRRGKILMVGAVAQIACILCVGIQWAWLRVTGWIGDPELEWVTRILMLVFIFPLVLLMQKDMLKYIFSRR
jgi:hypothetical protein